MTIQPGINNFIVYQGAVFNTSIVWKGEDGEPINLSGYTAAMQARINYDATVTFIDLNTENGGITIDPALGKISLFISGMETAAIDQNGVYDLYLTDSGGTPIRLLMGTLTTSPDVTR